jgi:hypothetical protein
MPKDLNYFKGSAFGPLMLGVSTELLNVTLLDPENNKIK